MGISDKYATLINKILDVHLAGYRIGLTDGDRQGYQRGYDEGYPIGVRDGRTQGYQTGYDDGYEAGSVYDFLQYTEWAMFTNLNLFGKTDVVVSLPYVADYENLFLQNVENTTVKHLTLNEGKDISITAISYAFDARAISDGDTTLEEITLNCDLSNCEYFDYVFNNLQGLKVINGTPIDFSSVLKARNFATNCFALEEIRFAENSINTAISFGNSPNLSSASIDSLIGGLVAQSATSTTKKVTLNTNVNISDAQKNMITNTKKWTLVFSS